jgi:hypothetical protein
VRGEGYEPVYTSTIERFYRCFTPLNRFIFHRVERVHHADFTDRREKGLDGVKQNPVEMAGSEETAQLIGRKLVLLAKINNIYPARAKCESGEDVSVCQAGVLGEG